jgi:hypothetical protein
VHTVADIKLAVMNDKLTNNDRLSAQKQTVVGIKDGVWLGPAVIMDRL